MLGWLHRKIERRTRNNPARLSNLLDYIPHWYIRRLSQAKLIRLLRAVYRSCPAQRRLWNQAGVKLRDIRSPAILEHIPFTSGLDLAEHPDDYLCAPREELIHVVSSSGTKGKPKKIWLTGDDLDIQTRMIATHLRSLPGVSRIAAMFLVDNPTWSTGAVVRSSIEQAGMFGLLCGMNLSTARQVELIKEYGINCLLSTPSYVARLMAEAPEDLRGLGVRYIQLGGQVFSEEFRTKVQQAWGAKVLDDYGLAECIFGVASECIHQNGLHVAEVDYWVEVVNPATGQVLPEGREGELVITTLSRRGMPLIRYRTGDLTCLIPSDSRCECGLPVKKIGRIKGRVDDMLIIGAGENLYPDEIDRTLISVPGVSDYQLIIERDSYKDVIQLTVETNSASDDLSYAVLKALLAVPAIKASHETSQTLTFGTIKMVPPGSLAQGQTKTIRIIDKRPGKTTPNVKSVTA